MVRVSCLWSCLLATTVGVSPPAVIPHAVPPAVLPAGTALANVPGANLKRGGATTARFQKSSVRGYTDRKSTVSAVMDAVKRRPQTDSAIREAQFLHKVSHDSTASATAWSNSFGVVVLTVVAAGGFVWRRRSQAVKTKDLAAEMTCSSSMVWLEQPKFAVVPLASDCREVTKTLSPERAVVSATGAHAANIDEVSTASGLFDNRYRTLDFDPLGNSTRAEGADHIELQNSRLAMIASMRAFAQHQISGNGFPRSRVGQISRRAAAQDVDLAAEDAVEEGPEDAKVEEQKRKLPPPAAPFDPSLEPGAMAPLGFFDPLGFSPMGDRGTFRNLRAAEVKHGRVAMLASVGLVFQHFQHFPFLGFNGPNVPNGVFATEEIPVPQGAAFLALLCGVVELVFWTPSPDREPGDFGDPLGLGMYDREMRERELNNGRFAMFATFGILAAELATGKDAVEQLGF